MILYVYTQQWFPFGHCSSEATLFVTPQRQKGPNQVPIVLCLHHRTKSDRNDPHLNPGAWEEGAWPLAGGRNACMFNAIVPGAMWLIEDLLNPDYIDDLLEVFDQQSFWHKCNLFCLLEGCWGMLEWAYNWI